MERKGARMEDLHNSYPKLSGSNHQTFHCVLEFCGLGIWGRALLGDPFVPHDISWGHFGGIQLAAGLIRESRTD